jgi:methyl coenzyme M reductase beta subunit
MESATPSTTHTEQEVYNQAIVMLFQNYQNEEEVIYELVKKGYDEGMVEEVVTSILEKRNKEKSAKANKDMLFGAMWCIGGTVATMANIGYIFWGAIVFGGIQF